METYRHEKKELELYLENTEKLYKRKKCFVQNVRRKLKRGTYDADKAPQLWLYWVTEGAQRYCQEYGCKMRDSFPIELRREIAAEVAKDELEEIQGNPRRN